MDQKGYSLVELITTISIIAILTSVGIPAMRSLLESNRLRAASEELYQRLNYAKSTAISGQQTIFMPFVTGNNWCYGTNQGANCDCTNLSSCSLGAVSNANNQVSLNIAGFDSGTAQIVAGRGIFNQSGSATFTLNGKSIIVKASRMGRISICSDSIGGYKPC